MDANELTALSACDIARGAARGDFRPAEIARAFLARAAARADLNAFLRLADDEEIDDQCRPTSTPLRRADFEETEKKFVPVALKDIFCVKGQPTTCASKMLENFRPTYDAAVVENLRAAAMPIIGKTNMDEFAMGSSGENSAFGATKNPWDLSRSPGGSSSGAAAAVAARLCPLAIGTDTGGSVRQPAAFCGVTAIKPTYGRISRWGMIAFASSFDQAGVIARDAADCALGLSALCDFDPRDSTSIDSPREDFAARFEDSLVGRKIGVPDQFFADGLDDETAQKTKDAIDVFESLGAETVALDMPALDLGVAAYYVLSAAEASSNLSRYDGVRYGLRVEGETLEEMYKKTRAAGFGREVKRRILLGAYALSYGYRDEYYRRAAKIRHLVADDFARAFNEYKCDFIAGPTTPGPAFQLGEMRNDPARMYRQDIYTAPVNLAGLPAMSVPCGFVRGLPVGLHLIGRGEEEAKLLSCARRFQEATDYHLQTPPEPTAATR